MENLTIDFLDGVTKKTFILTYGLHKELHKLLLQDDNLFKIYSDTEITEAVIQICLSRRDSQGNIEAAFTGFDLISADEITKLLDYIFEYFSDFFLKQQEKMTKLSKSLNQISEQ